MSPVVSTGSNSKADAPSTQPSESPSMNPTVELPYPSGTPSESPSLSPVTSSPTDLPSNNPSIPPGSTPSFQSSQVLSYSMSPTIDCSAIVARLKIQATTGEHLQMFEVQVYSHKVNVALGGIASQSTTYKGNERFAASKAIDGDNSTFSHTGDTNAYWQVDLGQSRRVHKVIIVNRYCSSDPLCLCRLSYANLILLDDAGGIITTRALGNTCGKLLVDESFKLSCPSGTPSENPSLSPVTSSPTDLPSSNPSISPSSTPTDQSSAIPSFQPSQLPSYIPTKIPSVHPSASPTFRPSNPPTLLPTVTQNMECLSIYSIVEDLQKEMASKATKQAKRKSNEPTPAPIRSSKSVKEESFFCNQIKDWYSGDHPRYDVQTIASVPANETDDEYPVAIKIGKESSETSAVVIGLAQSAFRSEVNIIDAVINGTAYYPSSRRASLQQDQRYTISAWQGDKELSVRVRSVATNSAVVELNYDNAVPNDSMTNLILCGYQGWFAFPGDGAPIDKWKHWFSKDPILNDLTVEMYPSVDEYDDEDLMASTIKMRDGSYAKFYSAARANVVKKHFEWMRDYGISGVFHMRFMEDIDKKNNHDWKTMVLRNVRDAAEFTGRVFAVSYNIAGNSLDDGVLDDLMKDWKSLVDKEHITSSSSYLHHNGLPVLRIYGIGFKAVNVSNANKMLQLIEWFKTMAEPKYRVFLVGGVPSRWRDLTGDSRTAPIWRDVYESLDGIHPWHVGRWSSISYFDWWYNNRIARDAARCAELGILYMPTMWPGFSWKNLKGDEQYNEIPRLGGNFMWRQAYNYVKNDHVSSIWMAQFDEVDEGTAIFKVAPTQQEVPAEGKWLSLDVDGIKLPNDWYLRLCGEAQKMLRGEILLTDTIPISP
ncbi:hypothetical protein ACHAXN_001969 [Cyclotella atomus]